MGDACYMVGNEGNLGGHRSMNFIGDSLSNEPCHFQRDGSTDLYGDTRIGGNLNIIGTRSGLNKAMVGLTNVEDTTDLEKVISTATQSALDLKAPLANPTFTGTVAGISKAMVGLISAEVTANLDKVISNLTQTALDLKANLTSISNMDNTNDLGKPISNSQQTALDLKAN